MTLEQDEIFIYIREATLSCVGVVEKGKRLASSRKILSERM